MNIAVVILGIALLLLLLVMLRQRSHLSLQDEERLLRDYFRKLDRGEPW